MFVLIFRLCLAHSLYPGNLDGVLSCFNIDDACITSITYVLLCIQNVSIKCIHALFLGTYNYQYLWIFLFYCYIYLSLRTQIRLKIGSKIPVRIVLFSVFSKLMFNAAMSRSALKIWNSFCRLLISQDTFKFYIESLESRIQQK